MTITDNFNNEIPPYVDFARDILKSSYNGTSYLTKGAVQEVGTTTITGISAAHNLYSGAKSLVKSYKGYKTAKNESEEANWISQNVQEDVRTAVTLINNTNKLSKKAHVEVTNAEKRLTNRRIKIQKLSDAVDTARVNCSLAKEALSEEQKKKSKAKVETKSPISKPKASTNSKSAQKETIRRGNAKGSNNVFAETDEKHSDDTRFALFNMISSFNREPLSSASSPKSTKKTLKDRVNERILPKKSKAWDEVIRATVSEKNIVEAQKARDIEFANAQKDLDALTKAEKELKQLRTIDKKLGEKLIEPLQKRSQRILELQSQSALHKKAAQQDLIEGSISTTLGLVQAAPLILTGRTPIAITSTVGGAIAEVAKVALPPVAIGAAILATPIAVKYSFSAAKRLWANAGDKSYNQCDKLLVKTCAVASGAIGAGFIIGATVAGATVAAAAGASLPVVIGAAVVAETYAIAGARPAAWLGGKAFNGAVRVGSAFLNLPSAAINFVAKKITG